MSQEPLSTKKGIPDIVFLLDATGSMGDCLNAIAKNIERFIDSLANPDPNGGLPVHDWRIRVVAYRDRDCDGDQWWIDTPFETDVAQVKAHLEALEHKGGGDEPESLLDALYTVSQWPATEKDAPASPTSWRHRHDATRVVVIFTDASCKATYTATDGSKGSFNDIINLCNQARLKVMLFAPEAPCYSDLQTMNGLEWEPVGKLGEEPQKALEAYSGNQDNFRNVMKALAKTIATASNTPAL